MKRSILIILIGQLIMLIGIFMMTSCGVKRTKEIPIDNILDRIDTISSEIAKYPKLHNAYAYRYRGDLQNHIGARRRAYQDYTKAISISPKNIDFYLSRASLSFRLRNRKQALDDIAIIIDIDPEFELPRSITQYLDDEDKDNLGLYIVGYQLYQLHQMNMDF